ncbi:hypothetical protein SBI_01232 [Streptomyces bingchenggensis BCW-1]|uniref:Lipoprotein n=1 Tax=Streptomyces bingchenggensis (strain BCW-1) TaxID=749414 RepID=D7CA25_STRBB|nr:hypothetical protein SBI_01232 [Streptomyces bingchenggensis BCW-1]
MSNEPKPRRRWTAPEKWQVWLGLLGLLTAVTGCVEGFVR